MRRFSEGDGGHQDDNNDLNEDSYSEYSFEASSSTSDTPSFNFKPTLKLSDTLKLPSISKCRSETNIRYQKRSVSSGKSILKSKSETQLVSILKESTSRESEEDRYLSGGYSEMLDEEEVKLRRPTLKYTKTESKNGTYGFDSCRYTSGGTSYSYKSSSVRETASLGDNGDKEKSTNRLSRSKSVGGYGLGESSTTSYTPSIDHFTLNVVDRGEDKTPKRRLSLADTLTFPKEYEHFTLHGELLGEYQNGDSSRIHSQEESTPLSFSSNTVKSRLEAAANEPPPSRPSSRGSTSSSRSSSSSSSEELLWSPRVSNVRAEPMTRSHSTSRPATRSQPRSTPVRPTATKPANVSYASRSTGPRPSAVSRSLTASRQINGVQKATYTLSENSTSVIRSVARSHVTSQTHITSPNHYALSRSVTCSTADTHFNSPLTPQKTQKRPETVTLSQAAHVTQPVSAKHVTKPAASPQNSPPRADLLASIAHIVPLIQSSETTPPAVQSHVTQKHVPPPPPRDPSTSYQNSKSRAVANLRNRQLLQARGIRVLPPSPLRWVCYVREEEEEEEITGPESVVSRDPLTNQPDLSIMPRNLTSQADPPTPKRGSLFRPQKLGTIMESRDSVFKTQTETSLFKSRDLLEKFKFRKPTSFSLAKNLVDEILLFPIRYLLIKQEKLRKYALLHSAVTNCYIHNTGWSRDEKSRLFSKAEGPFIRKKRR